MISQGCCSIVNKYIVVLFNSFTSTGVDFLETKSYIAIMNVRLCFRVSNMTARKVKSQFSDFSIASDHSV